MEDQQFLTLSCKLTKEVVSLDLAPDERQRMVAAGPGQHLTPQQFHHVIASAAARKDRRVDMGIIDYCAGDGQEQHKLETEMEAKKKHYSCKEQENEQGELVVIDVRNIYETEIGKFECPANIPVLDPKTRKVIRTLLLHTLTTY